MVFSWLFGDKKKEAGPDVGGLLAQAEEATQARDVAKGESLCREVLKLAPDNADAWNMLGVNLVRKNLTDPETRAQAVLAWQRALALRPNDDRASKHLKAELDYADPAFVKGLASHLGDAAPGADDAAAALARLGGKAREGLEAVIAAGGPLGERARSLLASF